MKSALLIVALAALLTGCSTNAGPSNADSSTSDQVQNVSAGTQAASASAVDIADSVTVDTPPEVICRAFIECLRRGESSRAEKFLSQESITQTRKHSLDLATPAGPNATFTVGAPQFATSQQKVAFVAVDVDDPGAGGSVPNSFSMMLRSGKFGWKISGIMLATDGPNQDLFSFENPLDVMRIKSIIEGEERQARASTETDGHRYQ